MAGLAVATPPYYYNKPVKQDTVIVKEKVVEFDSDVYLGLGGYYAVGEQLAEKHSTSKLLEKQASQIDELIKLLKDKYNNGETKPTEQPQPVDPVSPPSDPVPVPNVSSLSSQVFQIFKNNCINCHGPNQAEGKLRLIANDEKGNYLAKVARPYRVYDRVAGIRLNERKLKLMPVGGHHLSDEDVSTIWLWAVQEMDKVN